LPPSSLRSLLLRNLTPASRCQDHTSSPSASAPFVKGTSAATASHPALVTIAKRPSYRDGTKSIYHRFGPEVKLNSEKQKCIGGQVRSDEAARGADKRKSGAMRSRAGEPVPEIRTAKNPVRSKSRRGHYGGWAQTLGRECARVGLLSRFHPRSPAWIWRIPYPQSKKQNPVRGGQTSDGAVGRAVVSNQRIALCGSAKRNFNSRYRCRKADSGKLGNSTGTSVA
jgi:hypothetical protein